MVTHNNKIRRSGKRRALIALGAEIHGVHNFVNDVIHIAATAVDKGQGIKGTGDSTSKFAVKFSLQRFMSPRSRLEIRDVCRDSMFMLVPVAQNC